MTFGAAISLITVMVSLLMALFTWRLSAAPGWRGLRWFSGVGLAVILYVAGSSTFVLPVSEDAVLLGTRVALIGIALLHCCWMGYAAMLEGRALMRSERLLMVVQLSICALALPPDLLFKGIVQTHRVDWSDTREIYRVAPTNPVGTLAVSLQGLLSVRHFVRLVVAIRRGTRGLLLHALSLVVLGIGALGDLFIISGHHHGPYLFTFGLLGVVCTIGFAISRRVVEDARRLQQISSELAEARRALVRRERLAAVGEIAAVVAHEVRNPLGVLYNVFSQLQRRLPPEAQARDTIGSAVEASERIERTISDLLQAAHATPQGGEAP